MQRAYLGDLSGIPGIDTAIGVGIICNTAEQAERYVSLIGAGQESEPAIKAVNMEGKIRMLAASQRLPSGALRRWTPRPCAAN